MRAPQQLSRGFRIAPPFLRFDVSVSDDSVSVSSGDSFRSKLVVSRLSKCIVSRVVRDMRLAVMGSELSDI